MNATLAAAAPRLGMTAKEILWDVPLSYALQLLHALSASNGVEFEWLHVTEPSVELVKVFEEMESQPVNLNFE